LPGNLILRKYVTVNAEIKYDYKRIRIIQLLPGIVRSAKQTDAIEFTDPELGSKSHNVLSNPLNLI